MVGCVDLRIQRGRHDLRDERNGMRGASESTCVECSLEASSSSECSAKAEVTRTTSIEDIAARVAVSMLQYYAHTTVLVLFYAMFRRCLS